MALSEENSRRIQDYLDGSLSAADRQQFERDCKENQSLAAALDVYRSVQQALDSKEALDFRKSVMDRIAQHQSPQENAAKTRRNNGRKWIFTLIVFALVGVAFFLFKKSSSTPKPENTEQQATPSHPLPAEDTTNNSINIALADDGKVAHMDLNKAKELVDEDSLSPSQGKPQLRKQEASAYRQLALSEYEATTFVFRGITADAGPVDSSELALRLFAQANATMDASLRQNLLKRVIGLLGQKRVAEDKRLMLTRAQAHFQCRQYGLAAEDFKSIQSNFIYGPNADWGLTLCYLAQMPAESAAYQQAIGLILKNESHSFHPRATSLQKRVEAIR